MQQDTIGSRQRDPLSYVSFRSVLAMRWSKAALLLLIFFILMMLYLHAYIFAATSPTLTVPAWSDLSTARASKGHKPRVKVIVLSYMRSGSTLCGDILQAHPQVFYVYEPLLYLWDHHVPYKDVSGLTIRQRTKHHWRVNKPVIPPPLTFLSYVFNCNLTRVNIEFLTNVHHSKDFRQKECFHTSKYTHVLTNITDHCARDVQQRCTSATTLVQKVVRLTMKEADEYLTQHRDVRVIHLVRDPRGILLSRMHFNRKTVGEMHNNYTAICRRLWDDIVAAREATFKHPDRILTVRYEDLAQHPLAVSNEIYNFVGLQLSPSIVDYVRSITSTEATNFGKTALKRTSRKNPFRTAYHWRQELPFSLVQQVDTACRSVLDSLGYFTFSDEAKLRQMDLSAKTESLPEMLQFVPGHSRH